MTSLPHQNLTQWSGPITHLASDLSWARQKYNCKVQCVISLCQSCCTGSLKWLVQKWARFWLQPCWMAHCFSLYPQWPWKSHKPWADKPGSHSGCPCEKCTDAQWLTGVSLLSAACRNAASQRHQKGRWWACGAQSSPVRTAKIAYKGPCVMTVDAYQRMLGVHFLYDLVPLHLCLTKNEAME